LWSVPFFGIPYSGIFVLTPFRWPKHRNGSFFSFYHFIFPLLSIIGNIKKAAWSSLSPFAPSVISILLFLSFRTKRGILVTSLFKISQSFHSFEMTIGSSARSILLTCHFRASFVEMTIEAGEISYSHSSLMSFHSGFIVFTKLFFFSRRHFFISFSLAIASYTSVVCS
jgi:hypothetical protein